MKRLAWAGFLVASALISSKASARIFTFHGTVCQPINGSIFGAEYTQFGVHNVSGAPITVECPFPLTGPTGSTPTITGASTFAYDRSTTADVSCDLQKVAFDGSLVLSINAHTTGGGPGSGFQGMSYAIPAGTLESGYWRIRCTIPAVQSGAFSHVTATFVTDSE